MSGYYNQPNHGYGGNDSFEAEVAQATLAAQATTGNVYQRQGQFQPQEQSSSFAFLPHSVRRQINPNQRTQHEHSAAAGSHQQLNYNSFPVHASSGIQQLPPSGYTVTPMGLPANVSNTNTEPSTSSGKKKGKDNYKGKKKNKRVAGGQVWEDPTLAEWPTDDFRLFAGDLGNDVSDEVLIRTFNKYPSFLRAKVVKDKKTNKSKGYGFISFKDPEDFIRAMRDMNGKYVGSRPIKLRKSTWKERNLDSVKKKQKERAKLGLL